MVQRDSSQEYSERSEPESVKSYSGPEPTASSKFFSESRSGDEPLQKYGQDSFMQMRMDLIHHQYSDIMRHLQPLSDRVAQMHEKMERFVTREELKDELNDKPTRNQFRGDIAWIFTLICSIFLIAYYLFEAGSGPSS